MSLDTYYEIQKT